MHTPGSQPRWWHGATLYQIYVRSWQDSNDDGYGDLRRGHRPARLPVLARRGRHLAVPDHAVAR